MRTQEKKNIFTTTCVYTNNTTIVCGSEICTTQTTKIPPFLNKNYMKKTRPHGRYSVHPLLPPQSRKSTKRILTSGKKIRQFPYQSDTKHRGGAMSIVCFAVASLRDNLSTKVVELVSTKVVELVETEVVEEMAAPPPLVETTQTFAIGPVSSGTTSRHGQTPRLLRCTLSTFNGN